MSKPKLPPILPNIRLFGKVSEIMLSEFFRQQSEVPNGNSIVLELSTCGGDADIGRRIACELQLWQKQGREVFFLGKTFVYSAGITIMSAIPPEYRFLTSDCELLIHERKLVKEIKLDGALRGCRTTIQDVLAEIDSGQRLQRNGFAQLAAGTQLSVEDIEQKVFVSDWYLNASEAKQLGLVSDIVSC